MSGVRPGRKALIVLAAVVLVVVVFATGRPQTWVVERVAGGVLGGRVEVVWGGMLGDLRLDKVRVYPPGIAAPLLEVHGIRVDYSLIAEGGRFVRGVTLDDVVVHLDRSDPESPNYDFLLALLESDEQSDDLRFLPRRVDIGSVTVESRSKDGWLEVRGAELGIALESAERIVAALDSRALAVAWWADTPDDAYGIEDGAMDVDVRVQEDTVSIQAAVSFPDLVDALFDMEVAYGREFLELDTELKGLDVYGARFAELAEPILPIRIDFERVRFEPGRFRMVLDGESWPVGALSVEIERLVLGEESGPYYEGDLDVSATLQQGEHDSAELMVAFDGGQELHARAMREGDVLAVTARLADWTKEAFVETIPAAFRGAAESLDIASVSGEFEFDWAAPDFDVGLLLESTGTQAGAGAPVRWAVDAHGAVEDGFSVEGSVEVRLGDEVVRATARYGDAGDYRGEVLFREVQLVPWVEFLTQSRLADGTAGTLEGRILAESAGQGAPIVVTPELTLTDLAFGDALLARVDIRGGLTLSEDGRTVEIATLSAEADDYVTRAALVDWRYDLEEGRGQGQLEGALDMSLVGSMTGFPDMYGEGSFEGTAAVEDGRLEAPVSFRSDLGVGELSVPYGSELVGRFVLEYDSASSEGAIEGLEVTVGEGTRLAVARTTFSTEPFSARGEMVFESDLQVLVDTGWLKEAEASAREETSFELTADGLRADWRVSFEAESLELLEDAGTAEGVTFSASGTYDGALDGEGSAEVRALSAGGGTVHAIRGAARLEGTKLKFPSAEGRVFDGTIRAELEIGVLEDDFPIWLSGDLSGIDLAVMTKEVEPPNTELTGIGGGTLAVEYTIDGLESLMLDVDSDEGFSVNRALVEDLLQTDTFLGGAGTRVVKKTMDKLLGDAPQRPFDSGKLFVYLIGEEIQGVVELKSEKTKAYNGLNLTVNLEMDQSALAAALKLLEESDLVDMEM